MKIKLLETVQLKSFIGEFTCYIEYHSLFDTTILRVTYKDRDIVLNTEKEEVTAEDFDNINDNAMMMGIGGLMINYYDEHKEKILNYEK